MIQTEEQYKVALMRMEELLSHPENIENQEAPGYEELDLWAEMVAEYEEKYYPVCKPTLIEAIRVRMAERGLTQKALAELLGVSTSRVSEYLNEKSEPSLKVAREISKKLDIDASIVLGV